MPELEPQTAQSDPIASLHKMSTTAGVASQDYVAINGTAVAAAVLALVTLLTFLSALFLVVGLAAIVCGGMALYQIRNSNGTQGGRALAWAGILISLLIGGTVLANEMARRKAEDQARVQINAIIEEFGKLIMAGQYDEAYQMCHADFQREWTREQFEQVWRMRQDPDRGAIIRKMYGNNLVGFEKFRNDLVAYTSAVIHYQVKYHIPGEQPKTAEEVDRLAMGFLRDATGQWRVLNVPLVFNKQRR